MPTSALGCGFCVADCLSLLPARFLLAPVFLGGAFLHATLKLAEFVFQALNLVVLRFDVPLQLGDTLVVLLFELLQTRGFFQTCPMSGVQLGGGCEETWCR